MTGLKDVASWVEVSTNYWADMIDKWKVQPNTFLSYRQLDDNEIDATPGGEPLICYWEVPDDEVMVIRVTPPKADYWAVEFGSYWWETMDYRYRMCSTNNHMATLEDDGELLLVVSHEDLGYANWLDPSAHQQGYITVRYLGAKDYPIPKCQQMKKSEVAQYIPAAQKVTSEERKQQLTARRHGVIKRFKY